MIKRFIIAFVLLVLVCGGIVGFNMFRDQAIEQYFANAPVASVTVSAAVVEPVTWKPAIEALGTALAASGVDLTVESTGIVQEILFKANERVTRDALLVQMDDAVQKADLAAAQTQTELDKTALDRALELRKRGVGSEVTVDVAQAAASASGSQLAKFRAVLDQTQLKAPFDGIIGIPRVDPGQYISPGTIVATLQDLDTMRADFSIPEQQIDLLKIGQTVRLGASADDLRFDGRIAGIEPKVDPVTRMVLARAEVSNPDGQLTPGQFVQVRVQLPQEEGVLAIAQTAVVTSLYGDYVFVVRPAEKAAESEAAPTETPVASETVGDAENAEPALAVSQVFVSTGRRSGGLVEILEGLSAGDRIVTAGQNRLSNGTPVVVDNTVDPAKTGASAK